MTPDAAAAGRDILSLDGLWEFSFQGPNVSLEAQQIRTPGVWQAFFPSLRNTPGTGSYRRNVTLPETWRGRAIHLVMEGVFHETVVLLDGRPVGTHDDGWTTLDVDLTAALEGRREFTLGIDAVLPDERGLGRASLGETFAAKQDWYGLQGGIWKPARIEARAPLHLTDLAIDTSAAQPSGRVRARGALSQTPTDAALRLTLRRDGAEIARADFPLEARVFDCEIVVENLALWSPETPTLYACECEVVAGGVAVDALTRDIGFRTFEARDGRLQLNGEPFLMRGALDQDWHPEEECRPPTPEFLEQRFRNAKEMGLNTLRCHVKVPDKLYFELADRLGLLVWFDMPYCEYLTPRARETVQRVFERSVVEHAHHPSICIWTLCNEGWGVDLDDNPEDRRWLLRWFDEAKARVPGSLVVDNSPCFPRNYHLKTDIEDFHWYNGFPHQNAAFRATTQAFARRAAFPWSPHGDAVRRGDEPLICSEFGVWGLPHPRDILEKDGAEPWWFESGHDWNQSAAYPHGMATRFRDAGLGNVFGDLSGFVDAAQDYQFRGLKEQIETLRWEPTISGYVITELNDTQWEANGLMDVRNRPRAFADRLARLQTPWLALARASRTTVACGERFEVDLRLVGPTAPPRGARIVWRWFDASGEIAAGKRPAEIALVAPQTQDAKLATLEIVAYGPEGQEWSRNAVEFCIVPALAAAPALAALDAGAANLLAALRWPNVASPDDASAALLATRLTGAVRAKLLEGREVLLIANAEYALDDPQMRLHTGDRHNFPRMSLRKRDQSVWDGRWMGGFTWRRKDGPWAALPGGPMLDEHWIGLTPQYVLTSFLSTSFAGLVDAGIAAAWLHAAAAFVKRTRLGPGVLKVSTFNFSLPASRANPLAPHLLAALASNLSERAIFF